MRPPLQNFAMLSSLLLFFCACDLKRDFNKGEPNSQAKGDRPQETGEGLPGYLIDPNRIQVAKSGDSINITGTAEAVQPRGEKKIHAVAAKKVFRREADSVILMGRVLGSATTLENGSFVLNTIRVDADETLFLKLADAYADSEVAFKPGKAVSDRVIYEASTSRFQALDADATQKVSYDVDPVGTQSAQIDTLKATRACRACNLSGANLSGVDLNGCVLIGTRMVGTQFIAADLRNCQMQNTDLSNADLTRANLSAADLTQAVLTNANLTDAILTNVKGYQP